jgi:TRAP transporter 4TM/12TM fusion protein
MNSQMAREGKKRGLKEVVVFVVAVAWVIYQLATTFFGFPFVMQQASIHLFFALALVYLLRLNTTKKDKKMGHYVSLSLKLALVILSFVVCGYIAVYYFDLLLNVGSWNKWELYIAGVAIILILDATRREMGWPLPILTIVFLLYAYLGAYAPEAIAHPGFSIERIVGYLYLTAEGVFGIALEVSSTFVFMFILFGAVLRELGGGEFITNVATAGFGHVRGGPAKIAVVSSSLFGTVSGSGVANVATTGTFTIPMMKKIGYEPHIAGAIEAVASVGGQITPPIMGASAFLMAEILELPYYTVCLAAAIPAALYYLTLFVAVDLEAAKTGMRGVAKEDLPDLRRVLKNGWWFFIPPVILIYLLVVPQFSPALSSFWAIVANVGICLVKNKFSKEEFKKILVSFESCAKGAVVVAICCACVGIIIGITSMTGLGLKLSGILTVLAHGRMPVLLVLAMICSIILGMALPTVAVYLVLIVMIGPALIKMGVYPMAAHLFIFYFGIMSQITPPMALASYVGAGIAGAPMMKTGLAGIKLGLVAYILPFLFVYSPALLAHGSTLSIIIATATALIGVTAFAIGIQGYFLSRLYIWERAIIIIGSIALIVPGLVTDGVGLLLLIFGGIRSFLKRRKIKLIEAS